MTPWRCVSLFVAILTLAAWGPGVAQAGGRTPGGYGFSSWRHSGHPWPGYRARGWHWRTPAGGIYPGPSGVSRPTTICSPDLEGDTTFPELPGTRYRCRESWTGR
jgi:hypothetical protein